MMTRITITATLVALATGASAQIPQSLPAGSTVCDRTAMVIWQWRRYARDAIPFGCNVTYAAIPLDVLTERSPAGFVCFRIPTLDADTCTLADAIEWRP
jgi:hypothetical protein